MWIFVSFLVYLLICSIDATCKWSHTLFACLWFISLSTMPSKSFHVAANGKKKKKKWGLFVCNVITLICGSPTQECGTWLHHHSTLPTCLLEVYSLSSVVVFFFPYRFQSFLVGNSANVCDFDVTLWEGEPRVFLLLRLVQSLTDQWVLISRLILFVVSYVLLKLIQLLNHYFLRTVSWWGQFWVSEQGTRWAELLFSWNSHCRRCREDKNCIRISISNDCF